MSKELPDHVRNLLWTYFNFSEVLSNQILNDEYYKKQKYDKYTNRTALSIVTITILTTMTGALDESLAQIFKSQHQEISSYLSIVVILLAAISAMLSLSNRHYIEKIFNSNKRLEELNRHSNELFLWKREIVELNPNDYVTRLNNMEDKIVNLAGSVNATISNRLIHAPLIFKISNIDRNDPLQYELLCQYNDCIARICDRYDLVNNKEI
jgi:hypothetical protein